MKVCILYNTVKHTSRSDDLIAEQDVLKTVDGVGSILKNLNYDVKKIELKKDVYSTIRREKPDIVFNLCDSFEGPSTLEVSIPALLEILKVPYTGSGMLALSLCLNKARAKEILTYHNLPNAGFQLFKEENEKLKKRLKFPLIVKPNEEDASIGIRQGCVVNNNEELQKKVREIIGEYNQGAIVEEFIDGREFDVCVIGNKEPVVLPISETVYKNFADNETRICYYEAKWVKEDPHFDDINSDFPAKIPKEIEDKMREYARKAYLILGCEGYARLEMRLKDGIPYIIEVNPNPDLTVTGLFFKLAKLVGMNENDLISKIIDLGLERFKNGGKN